MPSIRTRTLPLALACGAVLLAAGPALADSGSAAVPAAASAAPTPARTSRPTPAPAPASARPTRDTHASPTPQVARVPQGAPDTGVPVPAGHGAVEGAALGALAVLGTATVVLRRRASRTRG